MFIYRFLLLLIFLWHTVARAEYASDNTVILSGRALDYSNQIRMQSINSNGGTALPLLQERLEQYRRYAKETGEVSYAAVALGLIKRQGNRESLPAAIRLIYADLLQFTHQFEDSVSIYQTLAKEPNYRYQAHIALVSLYLMTGKYSDARKNCKALKQYDKVEPWLLCQIWIDAMTSDLSGNIAKLEKLVDLVGSADAISADIAGMPSLQQWSMSILIDLLLQAGRFDEALDYLSSVNQEVDTSLTQYTADLLLMTGNLKQINFLPDTVASNNPLYFRYLIVNIMHSPNSASVTEWMAEGRQIVTQYERLEITDKALPLSLWYFFVEKDWDKAGHYAATNWSKNRYFVDALLLKLVGKKLPGYYQEVVARYKADNHLQSILL